MNINWNVSLALRLYLCVVRRMQLHSTHTRAARHVTRIWLCAPQHIAYYRGRGIHALRVAASELCSIHYHQYRYSINGYAKRAAQRLIGNQYQRVVKVVYGCWLALAFFFRFVRIDLKKKCIMPSATCCYHLCS